MIRGPAALILLNMMSFLQTADASRPGSVSAVNAGENVTLNCSLFKKKETFFYWYKQPLGQMVQTVASGSFSNVQLDKKIDNSRFRVREADDQYQLNITNVSKVDEATYFCHSGTAYSQSFADYIFLAVNDLNWQKPIHVKQSPNAVSVQLGHPINLQCSLFSEDEGSTVQCPGEHNVHWVRAGGHSHPGIIYTHKSKTEGQNKRTCVYRLSTTIQDSSDSGTYYCAVATCGQILFGEGTNVTIGPKLDFLIPVLGGLLVGCVTVIAILIFYIIHRRGCEQHKELRTSVSLGPKLAADQPNYPQDGDADTVNYVALDFSKRKHTLGTKERNPQQECVYSKVRADCRPPL